MPFLVMTVLHNLNYYIAPVETKNKIKRSINQSVALLFMIITFNESLSLVAFSVTVTLPTLSHFVSPSNIVSLAVFP